MLITTSVPVDFWSKIICFFYEADGKTVY